MGRKSLFYTCCFIKLLLLLIEPKETDSTKNLCLMKFLSFKLSHFLGLTEDHGGGLGPFHFYLWLKCFSHSQLADNHISTIRNFSYFLVPPNIFFPWIHLSILLSVVSLSVLTLKMFLASLLFFKNPVIKLNGKYKWN